MTLPRLNGSVTRSFVTPDIRHERNARHAYFSSIRRCTSSYQMAANDEEQPAEASATHQDAPLADATEPVNNHEGAEAEAAPGKRATVVVKQVEESESEGEEGNDDIDNSIVEMKDWLGEIPEDQEVGYIVNLSPSSITNTPFM